MHLRFLIPALVFSLLLVAAPVQAASPSGGWSGSWCSQTSGHSGPVKAHIHQIDCDSYRAIFVGRFAGIVPFLYPATLDLVPGTTDQYSSSLRMPLVGSYKMTATITDCEFHAVYEGCFHGEVDRGTFQMTRK